MARLYKNENEKSLNIHEHLYTNNDVHDGGLEGVGGRDANRARAEGLQEVELDQQRESNALPEGEEDHEFDINEFKEWFHPHQVVMHGTVQHDETVDRPGLRDVIRHPNIEKTAVVAKVVPLRVPTGA